MLKKLYLILIIPLFIKSYAICGQDINNVNLFASISNNDPNCIKSNTKDKSVNGFIGQNEDKNQVVKDVKTINKSAESETNYVDTYFNSIITSIIAAIIFWLVFSYIPEKKRRNKIRPILDLDMYHIYTTLFSLFDLIMKHIDYSPSDYQEKIRGNKLEREDIELGLQNKCLNETYLYDSNVNKQLLIIGKKFYEQTREIDETVDKLFNFSNYLDPEEILLFEKIRKKVLVYNPRDFNRSAVSIVGNMQFKPVNPSLSYMTQNISELYLFFIQLQDIVYKNNYSDRDTSLSEIQHYYYSGQYSKCEKKIRNTIPKYPKDENFLAFYLFLCEYMQGAKDSAYNRLEAILREKPHLVSSRGFIEDVIHDERVMEQIKKYYSAKEIEEVGVVLFKEESIEKNFIEEAKRLRCYYKEKMNHR